MHAQSSFLTPVAGSRRQGLVLLAGLILFLPRAATAQWQANGVPVCTQPGGQSSVAASIPGSIYLAWTDFRSTPHRIFAQRLDSNGIPQWSLDGIAVATAVSDQATPRLCGDNNNGVIITYLEGATTVRAQHLDSNGIQTWGAAGVAVSQGTDFKFIDAIIPDGSFPTMSPAGAVILWRGTGSGPTPPSPLWAQSMTGTGTARWTAGGIELNSGECSYPAIVTDGTGLVSVTKNLMVVWAVHTPATAITDIYAQRLSGAGAVMWTSGGLPITNVHTSAHPTLVKTAAGTAIVAWTDSRNGDNDVYAQQLGTGGPQWIANGLPVCRATGSQDGAGIVPDGIGGAIVAWNDYRHGATSSWDIYAERIDASGAPRWAVDGIPLCTAPGQQTAPLVTGDGSGGMALAWVDDATTKVMAQRVDSTGTILWPTNGVAVTVTTANQSGPALLPDFSGGAYVAWVDNRVSTSHIYANHILPQGGLAAVDESNPRAIRLSMPRPNPSTTGESVEFDLPVAEPVSASVYDVSGALVRTLMHQSIEPAGRGELHWDGRDTRRAPVPDGIYFLRFEAGPDIEVRRLVTMH